MLEFDSPMGSVLAVFRPFHREVGEEGKRKRGTGKTRRVNPNIHILHLQVQVGLAFKSQLFIMFCFFFSIKCK